MRQETPVIDAAQVSTSGKRGGDRPLKLLLPLVRPYWRQLAGGVAGLIVSSAMMLAMGWGLKQIVDLGFADPSGGFLNKSLLVLLIIITVMAVASYARMQLVYRVAERVTADLRKKIYKHLLTLDPGWFENNKTGDQVSKINADTTVLQVIITSNLPSAFRHFLMLMGGVVMLMLVSPVMTGMVVLVVPLLILPMIYFGRHVRRKSRETQSSVGEISSYTHETVQGIQTIQSFGYESAAQSRFDTLADNTYAQALKYIRLRALLTALILSLVFGAIGVVLWAGGHKVLAGEITGGELSAFIFYCAMVAGSVTSISEAMGDFSRASGAADRISALLAATPSVKSGSTVLPARPEGKIVFDHVTFSYPSRPESKALDEATFSAQAGEVVALVGPSGAGKSTVFHLLQRFYDSAAGHITIDGRDITACDPREVRRVLGVVAQDPVIFSSSIADNIRLGRPDATDDEVLRAAELAQADEFITALPQGYHTLVGERGNRLSGGQRQRIAIARALLKDPAILLLDEATSALDASNELAVHVALRNLMKGRTTLIIAHRLSTVQGADKIIVLDHGRVVGAGTHQDLYGHNSLYTHLAGLQMDLKAVS